MLQIASLIETKQVSSFDFMAPGMFTFASIFLIIMGTQSFTQDRENGMMKRIRVTPTTTTEFMISQVLSYMLIALIQAVIVFAAVYLMGFRPNVEFLAYALAFIFMLIFSLSNVGFGLITATVSKTSGAATGIAFIFVLPPTFSRRFCGSLAFVFCSGSKQIRAQLLCYRCLNFAFLKGSRCHKPNNTVTLGNRHNPLRKILQNISYHASKTSNC